jgi:anthranilate synthase component 1
VPVVRSMLGDLLTPVSAFLRISSNSAYAFLLESVEGGERIARYSFLGADPDMVVRGSSLQTFVERKGKTESYPGVATDWIREYFRNRQLARRPGLVPFTGGAVGYMGYDSARWFEPGIRGDDTMPLSTPVDAVWMFYRNLVVFDRVRQRVEIVSIVLTEEAEGSHERLRDLYDAAVETTRALEVALSNSAQPQDSHPRPAKPDPQPPKSNWTRQGFEDAVRRIKEYVAAGDCYQVVLSQKFSTDFACEPVEIYRALRTINPSPYTETEDWMLGEDLRTDEKEVAEHMMLVDLGRNDLGRVADYGSVKVEELLGIERYSHVQHLVTSLRARLRDGLDRFDALAACFPAGTVTGAPKIRAMEIIRDFEPDSRGVYAGAVLYMDYAANLDSCIAIRTVLLREGKATVQAGAGIVADSVPEHEYAETVNKARAVLKAIELAEKGL